VVRSSSPALLLALLWCAGTAAPASAIPDLQGIRVVRAASDDPSAFCADFRLTDRQAAHALTRARKISRQDYLERFDFLPCFVEGTLRYHHRTMHWEIRAGGNATITADDGSVVFLGCESCRNDFGRTQPKGR
jgi:hypothetical protein